MAVLLCRQSCSSERQQGLSRARSVLSGCVLCNFSSNRETHNSSIDSSFTLKSYRYIPSSMQHPPHERTQRALYISLEQHATAVKTLKWSRGQTQNSSNNIKEKTTAVTFRDPSPPSPPVVLASFLLRHAVIFVNDNISTFYCDK